MEEKKYKCRVGSLTEDGICRLDTERAGRTQECLRGNCSEYIKEGEEEEEVASEI
jgi:hypothetical protein